MSVTAQLTGFEAASEFSAPHFYRDTCGECAFLVLEHVKDGTSITGESVAQVRDDMQAHGYPVNGGTTMSELCDYFAGHRGLSVSYANGYGSSWDAIHQTLLDHAGRDGVVLEVELAHNLPGNEPGVNRHYIAVGGIHPTRGYLVANGDDVMALAQHNGHGKVIPTRWMDKNQLAAARPSAAAVVAGLPHQELAASALALPQAQVTADGLIVDLPAEPATEPASEPAEVTPAPTPEPVAPTHGELHGYSIAGNVTTI